MNRVQEVRKAYPEFLETALQVADPIHKNKYLMWIASQLANKHSQEDIKSTVNAFHKEAKRLLHADIYVYKDLKALEEEIKYLEMSKRQVEIFSKEMGAVKIYGDDICTLIRMNSKQAMLYYGKASRWCVAMEREDYWEDYSASGSIFYVLLDKSNGRKYAIQKRGLMEVTVWEENDNEISVDTWAAKNPRFESAVFACLHDREEPMLFKIKNRKTTREEVIEWIKYQHKYTLKFLDEDLKGSGFYLLDLSSTITNKTINHLTHFSPKDLQTLQEENPKFIDEVTKFLETNPKIKVKWFRIKLGQIIEDPDRILGEDDANFIKMKKDPSLASKLLKSPKQEVWRKALEIADPIVVLALLPSVGKGKRSSFIRVLRSRTNYETLIGWLSSPDLISKLPDNMWVAKAKYTEYGDDDDDEECDDEEEQEILSA